MEYILENIDINNFYNKFKEKELDLELLKKLKTLDRRLILLSKGDSSHMSFPYTILNHLFYNFNSEINKLKDEEKTIFEKNLATLINIEKFQTTEQFIEENKNTTSFLVELINKDLYCFAFEEVDNKKMFKTLLISLLEKNNAKKDLFLNIFYSNNSFSIRNPSYSLGITVYRKFYKYFIDFDLLELISSNENYLFSKYHKKYLDFFIEEKIDLSENNISFPKVEMVTIENNILYLKKLGFKTTFEQLLDELKENKTDLFYSLLNSFLEEAFKFNKFSNFYKLIFITMSLSNTEYLNIINTRLKEKKIDFFNREIIFENVWGKNEIISKNFIFGFVSDNSNEINSSFKNLEIFLGKELKFSNQALSYIIQNTSLLPKEFIEQYGKEKTLLQAFLCNFQKNSWSFLLKDIFITIDKNENILNIGLNFFKEVLLNNLSFSLNGYENIYHDLIFYREYLANNDDEKKISYKFDKLFYNHLISLDDKKLLKFLEFIDYTGKTILHNIALDQNIIFLKNIIKNIKDRNNSKLTQIFYIKDFHSKLFYEYLKEEKEYKLIENSLSIKNLQKQRCNYEFLFSSSLFDIIFNLLDTTNEKETKNINLEPLKNLDISKLMNEELKSIDNLKNIMKFTDHVNATSERALRKYLNNLLGNEAYKILNVIQRLGYSIVKNHSKSEDIINLFSKINNEKSLTKIVSIVINIMFPLISKNIVYDENTKLYRLYNENLSSNFVFIEKNILITNLMKLIYIDKAAIRNDGFFSFSHCELIINNSEESLLELLAEVSNKFYGEDIIELLKNLKKVLINNTKLHEYEYKYQNDIIALSNIGKNINLDHISKTAILNPNSKISEADFIFLKSRGYTIR